MIGDLFDSPWKVLIVAVVLIVLFGSKKLPDTARSLGRAMRILKKEVSDLHHDEPGAEAQTTAGQYAQIAALQQQVGDLQRAADMAAPAPAVPAGASSEPQPTQQPG